MKITSLVCPHKRRARVDLDGEPDREPLKNKAGSLRAAGRVSCLGTNPKGDRMRTVTSSVLYAKRRPGRCAMSGGLQMGSYKQRFRARVRCCCSTSPMKPKSKGNAGRPRQTRAAHRLGEGHYQHLDEVLRGVDLISTIKCFVSSTDGELPGRRMDAGAALRSHLHRGRSACTALALR